MRLQRERREERELSHVEGHSCQQSAPRPQICERGLLKSASQLIPYLYATTWNTPKGGQTEELLVSPQTQEEIK